MAGLKLTATTVAKTKAPGYVGDGNGLWLRVSGTGAKSWVFRFTLNGKSREMGLGAVNAVSLADARAAALECKALRQQGVDPIAAREAKRAQMALEGARAITFRECADKYIAAHGPSWRNPKHAAQWSATLATYAYPKLGKLSVASIDTGLVMQVLEPIWPVKPETASRVRGRLEVILDWAKVRGFREGENPARWRGHLDVLLPRKTKVRAVKNHAALAYVDLPAFMRELRSQNGASARCLEFLILTAARTGEAINARKSEFNALEAMWTIPGDRMKAGKEHRVPLSAPAARIAATLASESAGEFIFSYGGKAALSNMALTALLKRMERHSITVHGFRSTFKDWASDQTAYPNEITEMALAHVIKDKTEAAYRRGDAFERRRRLMSDWADYCLHGKAATADVIPLRAG